MTPATRKTFWWCALLIGLGGDSFFVFACLYLGLPPFPIYLWPATATIIIIVSIFSLKRRYRDETNAFAGFWQLSIIDLYAVTFFTAAWMAILRACWPDRFLPIGVAVSLMLGAAYTLALLVAARWGYERSVVKIPYAAGLLLTVMGVFTAGAIVMVCSYLLLYEGHPEKAYGIIQYSLMEGPESVMGSVPLAPLRVGIHALPLGVALLAWVKWFARKDACANS